MRTNVTPNNVDNRNPLKKTKQPSKPVIINQHLQLKQSTYQTSEERFKQYTVSSTSNKDHDITLTIDIETEVIIRQKNLYLTLPPELLPQAQLLGLTGGNALTALAMAQLARYRRTLLKDVMDYHLITDQHTIRLKILDDITAVILALQPLERLFYRNDVTLSEHVNRIKNAINTLVNESILKQSDLDALTQALTTTNDTDEKKRILQRHIENLVRTSINTATRTAKQKLQNHLNPIGTNGVLFKNLVMIDILTKEFIFPQNQPIDERNQGIILPTTSKVTLPHKKTPHEQRGLYSCQCVYHELPAHRLRSAFPNP